jgi:hypothetical protein
MDARGESAAREVLGRGLSTHGVLLLDASSYLKDFRRETEKPGPRVIEKP